jgi:hypothetical protein
MTLNELMAKLMPFVESHGDCIVYTDYQNDYVGAVEDEKGHPCILISSAN